MMERELTEHLQAKRFQQALQLVRSLNDAHGPVAARCYSAVLKGTDHPVLTAAAHLGMGRLQHRAGQLQAALASLQEALRLSPDTRVLDSLAHVYRDLEDWEQAYSCLAQAVELSGGQCHDLLLKLAHVCERLERFEEAIQSYERAVPLLAQQFGPCAAETRSARGGCLRILMALREFSQASELLESELMCLDPADPVYERCLEMLKSIRGQQKQIPVAQWLAKARQALQAGKTQSALKFLRQVRSAPGCQFLPEAMELWEMATQVCRRQRLARTWSIRHFDAHPSPVQCLTVCSDGTLVSAGQAGRICVHQDEHERVSMLAHRRVKSQYLSASRDATLLLSAGDDGTMRLWELATGGRRAEFRTNPGVRGVQLTEDGKWAFVCTSDGVQLWNMRAGHMVRNLQGSDFTSFHLSKDERRLITGRKNGVIEVWNTKNGRRTRLLADRGEVVCLSSTFDGRTCISLSEEGQVGCWDLDTGAPLLRFDAEVGPGAELLLSDDEQVIFVRGRDGRAAAWQRKGGQLLKVWEATDVTALALNCDGTRLFTGDRDGNLHVFGIEWELEAVEGQEWDERATAYLQIFLRHQTPRAEATEPLLPSRDGKPAWNSHSFQALRKKLQSAGLGWISAATLMQRLSQLAV